MTKALLAALVVVGSALLTGCAEGPATTTSPSITRIPGRGTEATTGDDETSPSGSSTADHDPNPGGTPATTTATPASPDKVDVKPIDPAKPEAPKVPAFACKTDEDSITASYKIALLRAPDEEGFKFWLLQVQAGQQRIDVLRNMVQSTEFLKEREVLSDAQFVNSLYTGFLARQPDEAGKTFWSKELESGASRQEVALAFVNSDEFADPKSNNQASCYF